MQFYALVVPPRSAPPDHESSLIEGPRDRARAAVAGFVRAIGEGSLGDAAAACAPNAVWWLPNGEGDISLTDAGRGLLDYLGPACSSGAPLIIVSDDGAAAVVEQVVRAPASDALTTVTSVLQLQDGAIAAGRTYADVAAWDQSWATEELPK